MALVAVRLAPAAVARLAVARLAVARFAVARLAAARLAVARLAVARFAAALLVPTLLAGCGTAQTQPAPVGNAISGTRLTIYLSAPLRGPSVSSGQAAVNGATLALDRIHARVGRYRISLRTLDDVPAGGTAWDGAAAMRAAQTAAADPTTIAYVGDLDSGASAVSIPILNRLGIAQVSPYSGAVGLTSDGPGSTPGEPQAYYPTPLRTFARVVPSDYVQAQVQVTLQRNLGCRSTYVLSDGEYDGESAAAAFTQVAARRHLPVVAVQSYVPAATSYTAVGQTVAGSGADCVLIDAITGENAVKLVTQVAAANPGARLFATAGLAESGFVDPNQGGVPASIDRRLLITAPGGDIGVSGGGIGVPDASMAAFTASYRRHYGATHGAPVAPPPAAAVDSYAATRLVLGAIARATGGGRRPARRVAVVHALFSGRPHDSPLGRFRIMPDGDTSLDRYDVYRVRHGTLAYWRAVNG